LTPTQQQLLLNSLTEEQKTALVESFAEVFQYVKTHAVRKRVKSSSLAKRSSVKGPRMVAMRGVGSIECERCPGTSESGGSLVGCDVFVEDNGDLDITCYYLPPWFFGWMVRFGWGFFF
jgi:hypothetical protein